MSNDYFGPGEFGGDPMEDFLARFFGGSQSMRRVDLGRMLSQEARQLLTDAARMAAELGSMDLNTEHLLWAVTQRDSLRQFSAGRAPTRRPWRPRSIGRPSAATPGRNLLRSLQPPSARSCRLTRFLVRSAPRTSGRNTSCWR
jgi:ATP-dependent Clp protease ATP-binding subunit ClpC